jgi:hypothetical protein
VLLVEAWPCGGEGRVPLSSGGGLWSRCYALPCGIRLLSIHGGEILLFYFSYIKVGEMGKFDVSITSGQLEISDILC